MKRFEERKQVFYNALSHLYDEKTSREIYEKIKMNYINLFNELKEKFESI